MKNGLLLILKQTVCTLLLVASGVRSEPDDHSTQQFPTSSKHVFELPTFYLRMIVVDDDLDLPVFQSHLETSTESYLDDAFEEMSKVFHQMEDGSTTLRDIQLHTHRISRAFVGVERQEETENGKAPISLILATMKGNITMVELNKESDTDASTSTPSKSEVEQIETILHTTLRFSLEDSLDLFMSTLHKNPVLQMIAEAQVFVQDLQSSQGVDQDSDGNQRTYKIVPVDDDTHVAPSSPTSFREAENSYRIFVAALAAFLLTAACSCCLIGLWRIRSEASDSRLTSGSWALRGDKLAKLENWLEQGHTLTSEDCQVGSGNGNKENMDHAAAAALRRSLSANTPVQGRSSARTLAITNPSSSRTIRQGRGLMRGKVAALPAATTDHERQHEPYHSEWPGRFARFIRHKTATQEQHSQLKASHSSRRPSASSSLPSVIMIGEKQPSLHTSCKV